MTDPNALAGLVFTYVNKQMKPALDAARKARTEALVPTEKHAVRHPVTGKLLGFETRTDPNPQATVSDLAALLPWMADNRPHDLLDDEENHATQEEIDDLVRKHLPERMVPVVRITEQGINAVLKQALADKDFRPPGVEVSTATGTTAFYPIDDEAIEGLITDRLIAWDGSMRELPSRESE